MAVGFSAKSNKHVTSNLRLASDTVVDYNKRSLKHQPGYCLFVQRLHSLQFIRRSVFCVVGNNRMAHSLFFCTTGACREIVKILPRQKRIPFAYASA